jgi:hypothetical protein
MSKDYSQFEGEELENLIKNARISRFYDVSNILIDQDGENTRTNKKSLINRIK